MNLIREFVSGMDITVWSEVSMVLFLGVFMLILARTVLHGDQAEMDRASHMPIADDEPGTCSSFW